MNEETLQLAVQRLRNVLIRLSSGGYNDWDEPSVDAQAEVLDRFQPMFARAHLSRLGETEFRSFLMFRNNRHWTGLERQGSRICRDMEALRQALLVLQDENQPIAERYNRVIGNIKGMGRAITTAVLLIMFPEKYGVWNKKSEAGLKMVELWPDFERGTSEGEQYAQINDIFRRLCGPLDVDLWTLDALWHYLLLEEESQEESDLLTDVDTSMSPVTSEEPAHQFGLERHLQDFLWDNWRQTELGQTWMRYTEPGDERAGYEYPCGVGRIDILARHREASGWLVIELKRAQTSDDTVGQILRYMGWVREHLAKDGETVEGLIICHEWDQNLYYAVKYVPDVNVMLYRVHFSLHSASQPPEVLA